MPPEPRSAPSVQIRAVRKAAQSEELSRRIGTWFEAGEVPDGEELRAGRLYRWRGCGLDLAIKFFVARPGLRTRLRPSPALRVARAHERLKPICTPRPLAVATGGTHPERSLLVYEYVDGRHLDQVWGEDAKGVAAFPEFLAALHRRRVHHGDFHLHNSIWNGAAWYLLDLDGLRHPFRALGATRRAEEEWSRVLFGLEVHCEATEAEVRALFERYAELVQWSGDREGSWGRIRALAACHRQEAIDGGTASAVGIV